MSPRYALQVLGYRADSPAWDHAGALRHAAV